MIVRSRHLQLAAAITACVVVLGVRAACGQVPAVSAIFPAGGQAGQTVDVTISGSNLQNVQSLHSNLPGLQCAAGAANQFKLAIPANTPPGQYDLWGWGPQGLGSPRTFVVGNRPEVVEVEPNNLVATATTVPLNSVLNGRIDQNGGGDFFRFTATQGQRVIVECALERIDSPLRATLEIFDAAGQRLGVSHGYFGIDPLIDFRVPADGNYVVKVHDPLFTTGADSPYRLSIDTGPRVVFSLPNVAQRGKSSRVALYGWNLPGSERAGRDEHTFDRIEVEIPAALAEVAWPLPVRQQPMQAVVDAFAYHLPGSDAPLLIDVTDSPVMVDNERNHSPAAAQELSIPGEVSGQLAAGDECDWYAITAKRGEVLHLEAYGQRLSSPVDLQVSIVDRAVAVDSRSAPRDIMQFNDVTAGIGGALTTSHLDPVGSWVCPADGRYLLTIRNLAGTIQFDPRRTYRLSIQREVPDFQLVAVPRRDDPASINVPRGGREMIDILAFRQHGYAGGIRVAATDLPAGVECPDIWLGPGVNRGTLVVSASSSAEQALGELKLVGMSDDGVPGARLGAASISHIVKAGTVVRAGAVNGSGRLVSKISLAVTGDAPLRIVADAHQTLNHHLYGDLKVRHTPGGIVDVAVQIERRNNGHQAPVKLLGFGLPDMIGNQTSVVPAGQQLGYVSFYLPPTLPVGHYSFVIRAETTVAGADQKPEPVIVCSNPVTINVQPSAFLLEVDPFVITRAKRGETIQIPYSSQRLNGFIGKMHTELATPGHITDVAGLRGRGETFTGQTAKGSLQVVVNDDAPLGVVSFLRLFTVGVVEDEAVHQGSAFFPLEIVE